MSDDHETLRRFYNEQYYSRTFALDPSSWHDRVIASRLGDLDGKQVLDVACGGGSWLDLLHRRGARISGVDISDRAIEFCSSNFPHGDFKVAPAEVLPFADGSFDLVTCLGSLEHFGDKPAALAEMVRVARPGARFLVLVPNAGFLTRRLGLYHGTLQTAVREDAYPLEEWEKLFAGSGLQVHARWRDLHPLSWNWISQKGLVKAMPRAAQAAMLPLWPMDWQYQVYHLLGRTSE